MGDWTEKEVETRGRLPLVRDSCRVDQQVKLNASESGVPAVSGDKRLVVDGLINQARRLCLSLTSESTTPYPPQVFLPTWEGGRKELVFFFRQTYVDQSGRMVLYRRLGHLNNFSRE